MAVVSYYADAHSQGPFEESPTVSNMANLFDASTSTFATFANNGAQVSWVGFSAPSSMPGASITQVRVRIHDGTSFGSYTTLTAPSIGWSWSEVSELICYFYRNSNNNALLDIYETANFEELALVSFPSNTPSYIELEVTYTGPVTKTQTAAARISKTLTKTQATKARISNTKTKTQIATARVQQASILTKTQSTVARIAKTLTKTQSATSRVSITGAETQTAIARISKSFTKTQTSIARIAQGKTKTQSATARVVQSKIYSLGAYASLPTTNASLSTIYTDAQVLDVSTIDGVYVDALANNNYIIHQFGVLTPSIQQVNPSWTGKIARPCTASPLTMQIYNFNTNSWETLTTDSISVNGVVSISGNQSSNLSNYFDANTMFWVRVYQ